MNEQPTNPPGLDVDGLRRGRSGAIVRARTHFAHADEAGQAALLDALVAAARDSAACLDLLLELLRVHRVLHPPLRRYLFSDDDIDAAEQRALVSIAYGVGSFRSDGSARAWLRQVAANEAKMLIRSKDRHSSRAAGVVADHADAFVGRMSTVVANEVVVARCLAELRPEWRRAIELREDGLPYEEVAARLDVPVGTAKTWVGRARRALADLLIQHSLADGT